MLIALFMAFEKWQTLFSFVTVKEETLLLEKSISHLLTTGQRK
ncbi:MAG: hypothetical protein RIT27_1121 [Pseudomonadota bacterium]|jgi:hypothetical protein